MPWARVARVVRVVHLEHLDGLGLVGRWRVCWAPWVSVERVVSQRVMAH